MRWKRVFVLLFLPLAACQHPSTTIRPQVSDQEMAAEKAYEQQLVKKSQENGGEPQDWHDHRRGVRKQFERVGERIETAGAELCREMGLPAKKRSCYYYFKISGKRDINAQANGKDVIINRGMLHFVANDDELAVVMGHELAHNLMGHVQTKSRNAAVGTVFGALLDGVSGAAGVHTYRSFSREGRRAGALSFSPEFEREADYVGLYIAARAGYDVHRALDFWRRLSVEAPTTLKGGATHPSNPERFVAMEKTIREIEYKEAHHLPLAPNMQNPPG